MISDVTTTAFPSLSVAVGISSIYSDPNATSVVIFESKLSNVGFSLSSTITFLVLVVLFPFSSIAVYVT